MDTETFNPRALTWGYPQLGNEQYDYLYDQAVATFGCRAIFKMGILDIVGNRTARQGTSEDLQAIDIGLVRKAVEERAKRSYKSYDDLGLMDITPNVKAIAVKSYGYIHLTVFVMKEST